MWWIRPKNQKLRENMKVNNNIFQKIMVVLLLFFALPRLFSSSIVYALQEEIAQNETEGSALVKLLETTNERLFSSAQALLKENEELKNDKAKLRDEINGTNRSKEELFGQFKIIAEENSLLKTQISRLKSEISNFDETKKVIEDANRKIEEIKKESESKNQVVIDTGKELDRYKQIVKELVGNKVVSKRNKKPNKKPLLLGKIKKPSDIGIKGKKQMEQNFEKTLLEAFGSNEKDASMLEKEVADMHYNMGVGFQKDNKPDEALKEYNAVLKIKPDDADTHFNMGLIYETIKNDRSKAIYHYTKYIDLKPAAEDVQIVKKYITDLNAQLKVWGHSDAKGIGPKEKLGRLL